MSADKTIEEIRRLAENKPQSSDRDIYCFRHKANIKTADGYREIYLARQITIAGQKNIDRYYQLFSDLAKELGIDQKISLKTFRETAQNLMFDGKFNLPEIKNLFANLKEQTFLYCIRVYGLKMRKDFVTYGKYTFVRKDAIFRYVESIGLANKLDDSSLLSEDLKNQANNGSDFVYMAAKDTGFDLEFFRIRCDESLERVLNLIRYVIGVKNERVYVDCVSSKAFVITNWLVSSNGETRTNSSFHFRDIPIYIDDDSVCSEENGNSCLWRFLSSEDNGTFNDGILEAALWTGKSIEEQDINVVIAELSFAFETMLCKDEKRIKATLSEAYAFINGNSYEERIKLAEEFREFYKRRSEIVHGDRPAKNSDQSYVKYYEMVYMTIRNLLTKKEFKSCNSLEEFSKAIEKMKYS